MQDRICCETGCTETPTRYATPHFDGVVAGSPLPVCEEHATEWRMDTKGLGGWSVVLRLVR